MSLIVFSSVTTTEKHWKEATKQPMIQLEPGKAMETEIHIHMWYSTREGFFVKSGEPRGRRVLFSPWQVGVCVHFFFTQWER